MLVIGQQSWTHTALAEQPIGAVTIEFEPVRQWQNVWGVTLKARPLGLYGATVALDTEEGPTEVPLATLCDEDVSYLQEALKRIGKETLFLGAVAPNGTDKLRQSASEWKRDIAGWAKVVQQDNGMVSSAVWNHIRNVRDPVAVEILLNRLAAEKHGSLAIAYVEAIASIKSDEASRELVRLSIEDNRFSVANAAAWAIRTTSTRNVIFDEYASLLKMKKFQDRAIMSVFTSDVANPRRRAGSSNYERHSGFTKSLISLLTTTNSKPAWIGQWHLQGQFHGYSNSSWGFHRQLTIRSKSIRIFFEVPYPSALQLLKQYTGEDYGYNKRDWYRWQNDTAEKRR